MFTNNYAAQAVRDLLQKADDIAMRTTAADAGRIRDTAIAMSRAQHFSVPFGGEILDDGLRGLMGLPFRLPYKNITVEFDSPAIRAARVVGGTSDANRIVEGEISSRVVLAQEIPVAAFGEMFGEESPADGVVLIKVAFRLAAEGSRWMLHPYGLVVPVSWEAPRKNGSIGNVFDLLPSHVEHGIRLVGKDEYERSSHLNLNISCEAVLSLCEALACSNVSTKVLNPVDPKVNRKREAKGKLPIYETKVLVVEVPKPRQGAEAQSESTSGDKRSSPREHLRRGHIRRLDETRRIWINSCVVGSRELGHVGKRYAILGEEER